MISERFNNVFFLITIDWDSCIDLLIFKLRTLKCSPNKSWDSTSLSWKSKYTPSKWKPASTWENAGLKGYIKHCTLVPKGHKILPYTPKPNMKMWKKHLKIYLLWNMMMFHVFSCYFIGGYPSPKKTPPLFAATQQPWSWGMWSWHGLT